MGINELYILFAYLLTESVLNYYIIEKTIDENKSTKGYHRSQSVLYCIFVISLYSFTFMSLVSLAIRWLLFDLLLNIWRHKPLLYIGSSSDMDKTSLKYLGKKNKEIKLLTIKITLLSCLILLKQTFML